MKFPLVLLCSAALFSGAALADDNRKPSGDTFATLDTDSDGRISKEEAAAQDTLASNFDQLDGNSDGYVSKREFRRNTMPKPNRD